MNSQKLCLLGALVLAACLTPASPELRPISMLPEVSKHLSLAKSDLDRGAFESARGHAHAVLVGDEITYAVSFEDGDKKQRSVCVRALEAAFENWQRELDGTLQFRQVADGEQPQISVVFKPEVRMKQEQVAGFTNWERTIQMNGSKLVQNRFHADMQIRMRDLQFRPMVLDTIRQVACHETGHVLGLDDSAFRGDLMGPLDLTHPVKGPTEREADSVRNLRNEARQIEHDAWSQEGTKL